MSKETVGTIQETMEAVERSEAGADQAWKDRAAEVLKILAETRKYVTSADLRDVMDEMPEVTHDLRAVGTAMLAGKRIGIIINSGYRIRARHTHGLYYVIWESLLYTGTDTALPLEAEKIKCPNCEKLERELEALKRLAP